MLYLTANLGSGIRRVRERGRNYLVAPVTMIVPGVLPGSKGPLLYPLQEIRRNFTDWEDTPITIGHPTSNGHQISASSAGILHIGRVRHVSAKDKLKGEAWIDEDVTAKAAPHIIEAVRNGLKVEISTGLYTDNELAQPGASYLHRTYTHVARNYRPDHLAVLMDQVGACSINDGCGLNVNARRGNAHKTIHPRAKTLAMEILNYYGPAQPKVPATPKVAAACGRGLKRARKKPITGNIWSDKAREAARLARQINMGSTALSGAADIAKGVGKVGKVATQASYHIGAAVAKRFPKGVKATRGALGFIGRHKYATGLIGAFLAGRHFSGGQRDRRETRKLKKELHSFMKTQKSHTRNAFCPTGEGGGRDNSCSSKDDKGVKARESSRKSRSLGSSLVGGYAGGVYGTAIGTILGALLTKGRSATATKRILGTGGVLGGTLGTVAGVTVGRKYVAKQEAVLDKAGKNSFGDLTPKDIEAIPYKQRPSNLPTLGSLITSGPLKGKYESHLTPEQRREETLRRLKRGAKVTAGTLALIGSSLLATRYLGRRAIKTRIADELAARKIFDPKIAKYTSRAFLKREKELAAAKLAKTGEAITRRYANHPEELKDMAFKYRNEFAKYMAGFKKHGSPNALAILSKSR